MDKMACFVYRILFLGAVVCITSSGNLMMEYNWPAPDPNINRFPHESSCHYYYLMLSEEDVSIEKCPDGQLFDYTKHSCISDRENIHCWSRHFGKMKHGHFIKHKKHFKCPYPWGKYPNLHDCSKYHLCLNGKSRAKKCAPFELFDKVSRKCIASIDAVCADKTDVVEHGYICPKTWGSFTYSKDCSKYYECLQRKPSLRTCMKGYLFDDRLSICSPKDHVYCGLRKNPYEKTSSDIPEIISVPSTQKSTILGLDLTTITAMEKITSVKPIIHETEVTSQETSLSVHEGISTQTPANQPLTSEISSPTAKSEKIKQKATSEAQNNEIKQEPTSEAYDNEIKQKATSEANDNKIKQKATSEAHNNEIKQEATSKANDNKIKQKATSEAYNNEIKQKATSKAYDNEIKQEATSKANDNKIKQKTTSEAYNNEIKQKATSKAYDNEIKQEATSKANDNKIKQKAISEAYNNEIKQKATSKAYNNEIKRKSSMVTANLNIVKLEKQQETSVVTQEVSGKSEFVEDLYTTKKEQTTISSKIAFKEESENSKKDVSTKEKDTDDNSIKLVTVVAQGIERAPEATPESFTKTQAENSMCQPEDSMCTTEKDGTIVKCSSSKGIQPHPKDERSFVDCTGSKIQIYTCPPNLIFNPDKKKCRSVFIM